MTSLVVEVDLDRVACTIQKREELEHFSNVSLLLWLQWKQCDSYHMASTLWSNWAMVNSQNLKRLCSLYLSFCPSYRQENTLQNTAPGQGVKCNLAPVKLRSSELTLVTCDRLSYHTSPYDIKKHTHRDSRNICRSWPWDQVSRLAEGRHGGAGRAAVTGKVGGWE